MILLRKEKERGQVVPHQCNTVAEGSESKKKKALRLLLVKIYVLPMAGTMMNIVYEGPNLISQFVVPSLAALTFVQIGTILFAKQR